MFRIVYNMLQQGLGFSGARRITSELSVEGFMAAEAEAEAEAAAADEYVPLVTTRDVDTTVDTQSDISFQRRVMAHVLGFLAGFPSVFTMLDLSSDAMANLIRDVKNPEFRGTWQRVLNGDWQLGSAIIVSYVLAVLAMAPFNYFNTYRGILASGRVTQDDRGKILKVIDGLDEGLKIPLQILFGAPVGAMVTKTYNEMFGRSVVQWTGHGVSLPTEVLGVDWWGILSAGIPIGNVVTDVLKIEVPMAVHNLRRGFFARNKTKN